MTVTREIHLVFLAALLIACTTSLLVTPLVRRMAMHVGMVDVVDDRRMHADPKPRIGGIAVYLGFAFALFTTVGVAVNIAPLFREPRTIHDFLGLIFGATLILVVGIWDDVMSMRPRDKFLAQIVVAAVSMLYGFVIPGIDVPFTHAYVNFPWYVGVPLTLVWYLGMMNAINFLDGLDGLLSGVTAISGMFLFAIALDHSYLVPALVLAALVGGALGFLPYNFNPSKIILGDTGALFIGYVFATVSVIVTAKVAITISLLVPLITLALPVLDTAAAIWRRARAGRSITDGDRGHFHHILVFRFGLDVKQAVLLIYAVSFVLGIVAFALSGGFGPHRTPGVL